MPDVDWLAPALDALPGVRWSICLRDAAGAPVLEHRPDDVLPTASVGKVLLLLAAARRLADGGPEVGLRLPRDPGLAVADSGLWQHLDAPGLGVADLAVLVAAVSDNWATNVLLDQLGSDVPWVGPPAGPRVLALHDRVRDRRGPEHPPTLSTGSAAALSAVLLELLAGRGLGRQVGPRVLGWLRLNADLSMVASAFGLDPLAHSAPDLGLLLANKTGTDAGIRADVGLVVPCGPDGAPDDARAIAYAVLAHWAPDLPAEDERRTRLAVLGLTRRIGEQVDALVRRTPVSDPSPPPAAG